MIISPSLWPCLAPKELNVIDVIEWCAVVLTYGHPCCILCLGCSSYLLLVRSPPTKKISQPTHSTLATFTVLLLWSPHIPCPQWLLQHLHVLLCEAGPDPCLAVDQKHP